MSISNALHYSEAPTPPPDSPEEGETAASSVEELLRRHADAVSGYGERGIIGAPG